MKTDLALTELGQVVTIPNPVLAATMAIVHFTKVHLAGAMLPNSVAFIDQATNWEHLAKACPNLLGSEAVKKLGFPEVASDVATVQEAIRAAAMLVLGSLERQKFHRRTKVAPLCRARTLHKAIRLG